MNNEAFLPPFRLPGKFLNMNKSLQLKLMNKAFIKTATEDKKMEEQC
jgi:hypothetical protein